MGTELYVGKELCMSTLSVRGSGRDVGKGKISGLISWLEGVWGEARAARGV